MVIGGETAAAAQQTSALPPATIDNIMSGIGNTGTVKMNNHRKKLRQRFDIIKKLGQGTYGKVQLGINKETGQEVAIKTIKKCKIETEADLIRIRREVQIMSSVQHPNIIHIYEVFENREKMVLVMEFAAGGELYDYLSERKVLSEDEARRVFRQISTAVYYCHKHKICHRDLKLENILLDEHGSAKIADFGLSNVFDEQRLLATFCGSPLYASPEIVKGTPYQGPEVDCWSLGVLLYTLVYGAMPFDGSNFKRLVKQISQGDYYEPKKASPASALIREMLTVCPKRRATIEQICNHWWVNEGYEESCLNLAEELANQTPVRLDVLLSLSPPSVTADQLVVPTPGDESKTNERVPRSHSVGSVIDLGSTEAERRILDMVAAGGEAALMPSPTRTITPAESPAQTKRKLEQTISTENATGVVKKKEKPIDKSQTTIAENMDIDTKQLPKQQQQELDTKSTSEKNLPAVENMCDQLLNNNASVPNQSPEKNKKIIKKKVGNNNIVQNSQDGNADIKPVKKLIAKTTKPTETILENEKIDESQKVVEDLENKCSPTTDEKPVEKRKSRIFEVAEKFQGGNQIADKPKKFGPMGVVGNFKKEFERKSSLPNSSLLMEKVSAEDKLLNNENDDFKLHESRSSIANFSLEEARKSMENSIALLNKARNESSKEVDQLCAKTENVAVSDIIHEREKKLKSAREIIGNAIQPGRLCMSGVRKPPVPFGLNGRSISGSVIPSNTNNLNDRKMRVQIGPEPTDIRLATVTVSTPEHRAYERDPLEMQKPIACINENPDMDVTKTSRAEITLKSATLPRRKPTKSDVHLDLQPKTERGMRFSTEMQHQIPDLRSAPIREHPTPYSPLSLDQRATSLEPQAKEHIIPVLRPPTYQKPNSMSSYRSGSGSLSRQSTNDSDTETPTTLNNSLSQTSTIGSNSQPIKKSPREFIIPIAVEGGGYVTPRAGSLEPSDSSITTNTSFSKFSRPRRIGSFLNDSEDESPFQRIHRHTSTIGRESDNEEPRFNTMHRLRSSRPIKSRLDPNDSASSGEDDDEDGFEILTAENLFSTLLSRVRALTNRLNVNDTHGFPSARIMSNIRQAHSPFWNHDPFGSNLNKSSSPWRHTMSRDLGSDIDSMFSRSGATLPRGTKFKSNNSSNSTLTQTTSSSQDNNTTNDNNNSELLDLHDLDLSRLRLTKKDLETLSSLTPILPKEVQEHLLSQLPPNQARKLSRTLSMQNNSSTQSEPIKVYKRSLSGGRDINDTTTIPNTTTINSRFLPKDYGSKQISTANSSKSDIFDRNSVYRRSLSKSRYDSEKTTSRSSSRCRDSIGDLDDVTKSYLTDVNKYKGYIDYNDSLRKPLSLTALSPTKDYYGSLPPLTGCTSPPPLPSDATLRRRSSQRRVSRFLRPDFFDTPREESIYVNKDNKDRDPESRRLLKEIRERSRERSLDRPREKSMDRLSYIIDKYSNDNTKLTRDSTNGTINNNNDSQSAFSRHSSVEGFTNECHVENLVNNNDNRSRRSYSRTRDNNNIQDVPKTNSTDKLSFTDKILNELQQITKIQKNQIDDNIQSDKRDKSDDKIKKCLNNETNSQMNNINNTNNSSNNNYNNNNHINNNNNNNNINIINNNNENKSDEISDKIISNQIILPDNNNFLPTTKNNDSKMVTNLTNEIESINLLNNINNNNEKQIKLVKKESKLTRPNSYPTKINDKLIKKQSPTAESSETDGCDISISQSSEIDSETITLKSNDTTKRPKSFPISKITPPKELKKPIEKSSTTTTTKVSKLIGKSDKEKVSPPKVKEIKEGGTTGLKSETKTVRRVVRIVKKSSVPKIEANTTNSTEKNEKSDKLEKSEKTEKTEKLEKNIIKESETVPKVTIVNKVKEESPEKKVGKGFLYSIGQKFEKFREGSKGKEKKSIKNEEIVETPSTTAQSELVDSASNAITTTAATTSSIKNESSLDTQTNVDELVKKKKKIVGGDNKLIEKKSKIDLMIRNLRERSVPRSPVMTESRLIKRAVSVEDLSGGFNNKCGVNKVLGLFKKFEKDNAPKIKSTKSSSNVETTIVEQNCKERPKSSGFTIKKKKIPYTGARSDTIIPITDKLLKTTINNVNNTKIPKFGCIECKELTNNDLVTKRHSTNDTNNLSNIDNKERIKNNRKGLMLDFTKLENNHINCESNKINCYNNQQTINDSNCNQVGINDSNCNQILINNNNVINNNTITTNGIYSPSTNNEINHNNHNFVTPTYENIGNYSSESRSPYEDCASTSTLFSPTDEPELCFDNWSVCSDDHTHPTPSPSTSRLSRHSQVGSPLTDNNTESIVDRIRRKSFYTRFNEKKPKRVSNIVGPAAKDYYRDSLGRSNSTSTTNSSSTITTKPEYKKSATTSIPDHSRNIHEYYRPMKTSTTSTSSSSSILSNGYNLSNSQTKLSSNYDRDRDRDKSYDYLRVKPSSSTSASAIRINDYHLPTRHNYDNDYSSKYNSDLRYKKDDILNRSSIYDPTKLYGTYNPKLRTTTSSSSTLPPSTTSSYTNGTTNLDSYVTLGRTLKPYDQRSMSLMDSTTQSQMNKICNQMRDQRASTDFGNISRHNIRFRAPSIPKSPTNII